MANVPAVREETSLATMDGLLQQATILVRSGLLPAAIKTPEQAVAIILKGRELGIGPLAALEHVYAVKQKTGLDGQLIQALLRRDGHTYVIDEESMTCCKMRFWRRGETGEGASVEVTWEEAQTAGWNMEPDYDGQGQRKGMKEKHTWKTQRATMLMWRCLAKGAKRYCGDSLLNTATAAELNIDPDDDVVDGEIVSGASRRRDRALPTENRDGRSGVYKGDYAPPQSADPRPPIKVGANYNPQPEEEGEFTATEEAPAQGQPPAEPPEELSWVDDKNARARFGAKLGELYARYKIKKLSTDELRMACRGLVHDTPNAQAALDMVEAYIKTVCLPKQPAEEVQA